MKNSSVKLTDEQLLQQIQRGQHELLEVLYRQHRTAFVRYAAQQLHAEEDDAADCFQEAVIVFYKNVSGGHLQVLSCSIRTYLFAIGKRMIYKRNEQLRRERPTDLEADREALKGLDLGVYQRIDDEHRREVVTRALAQLGDPCRQILLLFYYHHYPIESIETALGFSSPGAVRVKKLRCLEQLKAILKHPL